MNQNEFGLLQVLLHTGLMGKTVIAVLLSTSLWCWTIIYSKIRLLKKANREDTHFLDLFWKGSSLEEIFNAAEKFPGSPVAQVFRSGFKELRKLSSAGSGHSVGNSEILETVSRALSKATTNQIGFLEKHVSWLATTASAAPFVGLFGTVWGIMRSFHSIGATGAANLAVVAPGISEALITTALGIGAAIPAVVAYNSFAGNIKKLGNEMDGFTQDFMNLIQRSLLNGKSH